jgi:transposase
MSQTQPHSKANYQLYVGIDIALTSFEVACYQPLPGSSAKVEKAQHYLQNPTDYQRLTQTLFKRVSQPGQVLVVLEATSTYWLNLALHLHQAGLVVSLVNPAQAHYFGLSQAKAAKTDALDAQTLAELAQARAAKLRVWSPPPAIYHHLLQLLNYRTSLSEMAKMLQNQLHALKAGGQLVGEVGALYESQIADLKAKLKAVEAELEKALKTDPAWLASVNLITSVVGLGPLTACWLVVTTLNFTTCTKAASLAKYVGVAPVTKRSGTSIRGKGSIGPSSQPEFRAALFMAATSAAYHNPLLKLFYRRLREAGKAHKVAICAVARKLLGLVFALKRTNLAFDPTFGLPAA